MNRRKLLIEKLTQAVYSTLLQETSVLPKQSFLNLKKGTVLTTSGTEGSVEYEVRNVRGKEDESTKVGYVTVVKLPKPGSQVLPNYGKENEKVLSFEEVEKMGLGVKTIEDTKLKSILDDHITHLFNSGMSLTKAKAYLDNVINTSGINPESKRSMLTSLEKQNDLNGLYRWAANMLLAKKGLKVK